jgi:alpha-tubulin suppressor-like RCC1 family protein
VVLCWGDNTFNQTAAPTGSFREVSTSGDHACALQSDGTIACWGDNSCGQSLALLIQKVVSLAGNRRHSGDGIPAGS